MGGILTGRFGLGNALWIFGFLQMFSTFGYILVAWAQVPLRPLMYSAMAFENVTIGLAAGAYGVLLLRLTKKKFAATQYAFFTVLFALPRILAGPISGFLVNFFGCEGTRCAPSAWARFYWLTIPAGTS